MSLQFFSSCCFQPLVFPICFLLLLPTSRFPNFVSSCCFQLLVFLVFFLLLLYFQLVIVFPFFFLLLLPTSRFPSFFLLLLPTFSRFPSFFRRLFVCFLAFQLVTIFRFSFQRLWIKIIYFNSYFATHPIQREK